MVTIKQFLKQPGEPRASQLVERRQGKNKMLSGSCPASPPNTGGAVGVYVAAWKASESPEIQIRNVSPEGGKYQIRRGLNWLNSH